MNFKDIVNKFEVITAVNTHSVNPVLAVTGYIDGEIKSEKFEYKNYKVMLEVAEKLSYFIGVK